MDDAGCGCVREVTMAVATAQAVAGVLDLLRRHIRRPEAARHAGDDLRGLLADVDRKNGWQLAEHAGYADPRGMQRVLARYAWDADAARDDLRASVAAALGDPAGILVVDETGFPKQGIHSVGVARQYCGTLGKIANCQIGVFLGYAGAKGHAAIDRALYLPQAWRADPGRGDQAGVPAAGVVADAVDGSDGALRRALEARGQASVLAVRGNEYPSRWPPYGPPGQVAISALAAAVPGDAWQRLSCGEGAQGPRIYDWAFVPLRPALRTGWVHAVLIRRHPVRSTETAFYLVSAPVDAPLTELVRAAGTRWTIEEVCKLARGQAGLDHYDVRSGQGWHRHVTLALLALAALATVAKKGAPGVSTISHSPSPNCGASWSASSGRRPMPRTGSAPGHAGGVDTSASPRPPTAAVA